jgi:hypothetical protein
MRESVWSYPHAWEERKMKRLLIFLIICGMLAIPAMAMIVEEPTEGKATEQPTLLAPKQTFVPEYAPLPIIPNNELFKKKIVQYNDRTTLLKRIVMVFDEVLGLTPTEENIVLPGLEVVIDEKVIAIIPTDSKFNGIEPHEYCLEYQYGTTNWYKCEQELL